MKYFLITAISIILLSGCSYQNAFSKFDMTHKEELLASNTQSSKVQTKESVKGVFTAIYLNNVDEEYADDNENFIVGVYMKNSKEQYNFKLNQKLPLYMEKIEDINDYSELVKHPRKWDIYYFVRFQNSGRKIDFSLESDRLSSAVLHFLKDPL